MKGNNNNSNPFLIINEQEENPHKIREIGEVKQGFTYRVERSKVLQSAELFLPILGLSNQYVQKGSCEPEIISTSSEHQEEQKEEIKERNENDMEEDSLSHEQNEKQKQECYVEMNVALGVLEQKNENESDDEDENDIMIEELN